MRCDRNIAENLLLFVKLTTHTAKCGWLALVSMNCAHVGVAQSVLLGVAAELAVMESGGG